MTIIKLFIIPLLLCLSEQGTPWQFSKQISKLSFQLSAQIYSLLGHTEGERKALWRCKKRNHIVRLSPRALGCHQRWKSILFLCFLLDTLITEHCRTWSSIINLWIDTRTCQKSRILPARQKSNNYLERSKENVLRNMMLFHWPCFTWKFFKIWFHKIIKLILKTAIMS